MSTAQQPSKRGLASADKETRQRVASMGGKASHGGGRKSNQDKAGENGNVAKTNTPSK